MNSDNFPAFYLLCHGLETRRRMLDMLDMPDCLPRLRRYARCKQDTRTSPNVAQTRLPHVADRPGSHCLVVSGESGSQLLGCCGTKPWVLKMFASDGVVDRIVLLCLLAADKVIAPRVARPTIGSISMYLCSYAAIVVIGRWCEEDACR
jgi:hypothetical protein